MTNTELEAVDAGTRREECHYLPFDEKIWEAYESAINDVISSRRVLKKDKPETLEEAREFLLSKKCLQSIPSPLVTNGETLEDEIRVQRDRFMEHYNLSRDQYNYVMRSLVYLGDYCAKKQRAPGILVAWEKMKESGILPKQNSLSTYMYILGSDDDCRDTLMEVATFHDIFFSPNENSITLRIKHFIQKNQVDKAEEILSSLKDSDDGTSCKKLRTFLPILEHYCITGNASSILRIFQEMQKSPGVYFDSESYALVIASLAKFGHFRSDAVPIDGASSAGFSATCGPNLFHELATIMAKDILELSKTAAEAIFRGFREGFLNSDNKYEEIPTLTRSEETSDLSGESLLIGRVEIDNTTALCPVSGAQLRLIALDEDQRQHVHDTLIKMAGMQYSEYTKSSKTPAETEDDNKGIQQLSHFSNWLE